MVRLASIPGSFFWSNSKLANSWRLSSQILVRNTHKKRPITVGQYRKGPIYVVDGQGQAVYEGPPASEVKRMMDSFIQWMNSASEIHPLIKAALVHLYFVHVHPFDDGNGRSARALSNLHLMKEDYQFINFLAPSDYFDHHRGNITAPFKMPRRMIAMQRFLSFII